MGVIIHKLLAAAPRRLCAVFCCYSANICAAAYLHLCGACSWVPARRHVGEQRWEGEAHSSRAGGCFPHRHCLFPYKPLGLGWFLA